MTREPARPPILPALWAALAFSLLSLVPGSSLSPTAELSAQEPLAGAAAGYGCPDPAALIGDLEGPLAHVRYLADDALGGRETGSPGARCAADYIAAYFQGLGLQPVGPGESHFQPFRVRMGAILKSNNALEIPETNLAPEEDWIPFGFSRSASVTAPLVYGGAGVSRPGTPEDRFTRLELEGRIVVVEPSRTREAGQGTLAADPRFLASVAAGRRAAGVIVLLPEGSRLPDPATERRPGLGIPAVAVAPSAAEAVREAAEAEGEARLVTSLEPRMVEARNVVGLLEGSDPSLGDEVVVLGAHYDHLGFGIEGSLDPDARAVHNGADDNASGTAAVMEAARRMVEEGPPPARSVLFVAFTGEEKGLWGSAHYVESPLLPLERTVAMLNMDMVGRLRDNTLTVYGTGTAEEWPVLLEKTNRALAEPLVLASVNDGFGASDHSSFYGRGIPVLHFFTNTHPQYHRPEDDWDLINARGLERIAGLVEDVTRALVAPVGGEVVALTPIQDAGPPHGQAMAPGEAEEGDEPRRRSYGPYLGTIPDMTPRDHGVRITGVREESPAESAGLQGGDVIVEFGGAEITDLYAYTYALRDHEPGDEVTIVVLRDGERLSLTAVLGVRR